jgi:hypothetical protein
MDSHHKWSLFLVYGTVSMVPFFPRPQPVDYLLEISVLGLWYRFTQDAKIGHNPIFFGWSANIVLQFTWMTNAKTLEFYSSLTGIVMLLIAPTIFGLITLPKWSLMTWGKP